MFRSSVRSALAAAGFALCASLLMPDEARASLVLVTTRTGSDTIGWGQLGPDGSTIANPTNVLSTGGITATVSIAGGQGQQLTQGTSWTGNFTPGDPLYYTGGQTTLGAGPLTIDFGSQALSTVGAQIQAVFFGTFTAQIEAFNSSGTSLGIVTENGNSTSAGDGSAIYIGVSSTNNDISKIVFSTFNSTDTNDFAINQLSFTPAGVTAVPEPSTLLGAGLATAVGVVFVRRRRVTASA